MPEEMYVQCVLHNGSLRTVSWIPEKLAIAGNHVRLKGCSKKYPSLSQAWQVFEVWQSKPWGEVNASSEDYKFVHTDSVSA